MLSTARASSARTHTLRYFFTLVTGPRRSLSLKLSDTQVYEPQIRARHAVGVAFRRRLLLPTGYEVSERDLGDVGVAVRPYRKIFSI